MNVLIASLFRVFFCVIGGYFIGCALDRFEKKQGVTIEQEKKHEIVKHVIDYVAVGLAIAGGYAIGKTFTELKINNGLAMIFKDTPGLETAFYEASNKLKSLNK